MDFVSHYSRNETFSIGRPYFVNDTIALVSAMRCITPTYFYVAICRWDREKREVKIIRRKWIITSSGLRFR